LIKYTLYLKHALQNFFHQDLNTALCMGFSAYTVSGKKVPTLLLPLTLPNANRFLKFFHWQT